MEGLTGTWRQQLIDIYEEEMDREVPGDREAADNLVLDDVAREAPMSGKAASLELGKPEEFDMTVE